MNDEAVDFRSTSLHELSEGENQRENLVLETIRSAMANGELNNVDETIIGVDPIVQGQIAQGSSRQFEQDPEGNIYTLSFFLGVCFFALFGSFWMYRKGDNAKIQTQGAARHVEVIYNEDE